MARAHGTFITSISGHRVYIPDELPTRLSGLSHNAEAKIEEATFLLGQVKMCRRLLPSADLLIYSSLQREALASSTIEGTIATPEQLVMFQLSPTEGRSEVREVANYASALEFGVEQIAYRELTLSLILSLHEILLTGVRGAELAGRLKTRQNAIGNPMDTLETAAFVPSPPERVTELMEQLERYLVAANSERKVVQCALAHHQFETIHPFSDGNGRVGRLLIVLHLIKLGLLDGPLIYPSVFFERTRQRYYDSLQAVRISGDWDQWITYFAESLIAACNSTITFTEEIRTLQDRLNQQIADIRTRRTTIDVLNTLFEEPYRSTRSIAERLNVSQNTVLSALKDLQANGIVVEATGRTYGRAFACSAVLRLVFGIELRFPAQ